MIAGGQSCSDRISRDNSQRDRRLGSDLSDGIGMVSSVFHAENWAMPQLAA